VKTKAQPVGSIESEIPQRMRMMLTPAQQRVLELEDGDSFVLQTIRVAEGKGVIPKWNSQNASHIAACLSSWARGRGVRLAYRMVDGDSVRIWRLGAIEGAS
jgi:hypothetical protein